MENRVEDVEVEREVPEAVKEPERKSFPATSTSPYNPSLVKTYESSEFEQACPDILPGMIFGLKKRDSVELQNEGENARENEGSSKQNSSLQKQTPRNEGQKSGQTKQISSPKSSLMATPISSQKSG